MVVEAESWDTIADYYSADKGLQPMTSFVRYLKNSEYKTRLYGVVYFDCLSICGYPAFHLYANNLQIDYDNVKRIFNVSWYGAQKKEWEKEFTENEMIKQFPELIKTVSWY